MFYLKIIQISFIYHIIQINVKRIYLYLYIDTSIKNYLYLIEIVIFSEHCLAAIITNITIRLVLGTYTSYSSRIISNEIQIINK